MSAVHSFYCIGLNVSYVPLLEVSHIIRKFGLFAYSNGRQNGQNMLQAAYFPVYSPHFLLYGYMGLKFSYVSLLEVSHIICKFGSFAYPIWPPNWHKYARSRIFSCPQFLFCGSQNFTCISAWDLPINMETVAHLHIQDGHQNMLRTGYFPVYNPQIWLMLLSSL